MLAYMLILLIFSRYSSTIDVVGIDNIFLGGGHSEKSGAKMVPQRNHFGKRLCSADKKMDPPRSRFGASFFFWDCTYSRIVDPERKAYLVRNKNPSVIWILNDQNSSKWSILQSGSNWHRVRLVPYSTNITIGYLLTKRSPLPYSTKNRPNKRIPKSSHLDID